MGSDDGNNMFMNPCADGEFIVRALHEYHTDSVGHLSFSQFQYIKVTHREDSGWWLGESENNRGWFPSNRVERVSSVYESEITSEDYDQIRTGLDGVETQFLGEPVTESVSDSMHLDWGAISPTIGRTRAGQLAFPPSQLSALQPYYGPDSPPISDSSNTDLPNAYSEFIAEVTLYVDELREAASDGQVDRYQPTVANIISCVKALLIFTNTIARDSEVLRTYPELEKSRRIILRALGKLYSKCLVANGSQALTTSRQRQFAVEKLGIFSGQVLEGITEFATRSREIGLRIRAEITAASPKRGELGIIIPSTGDIENSPPSSNSHGSHGKRRRVSRAGSAKGYKSFNAVRQWKAEHVQKYATARKAIELLLTEYMDCLNGESGSTGLDMILRTTIQAAQAVEIFLASAEELKTRTSIKEENDYAIHRAQLSATSTKLFEYIKSLQSGGGAMIYSTETILARFMSLASLLLRCLVDLHPKSSHGGQEQFQSDKEASSSEDQEPEEQDVSSAVSRMAPAFETFSRGQMNGKVSSSAGLVSWSDDLPPKFGSSRNVSPPRFKYPPGPGGPVSPLSRKFASLNSLHDRYKRPNGGLSSFDKDTGRFSSDMGYDESDDLDRNIMGPYRSSHDSAVMFMSGRNTPHHSLMSRGSPTAAPIAKERDLGRKVLSDTRIPSIRRDNDENEQERLNAAMRSAERTVTEIFVPVQEMSQLVEEVITPAPQTADQTFNQNLAASSTPNLGPQRTSYSSPSRASYETSVRTQTKTTDNATLPTSPANTPGTSSRNGRPSTPTDVSRILAEDSDMVGLGVSVLGKAVSRNSVSPGASGQGSGAVSRSMRVRSPVPSSPNLEPSKRVQLSEFSSRPHSPSLGPEPRTYSRNSNGSSNNLTTAVTPSSKRESQTSVRSDISTGRRSKDSQLSGDQDSTQDRPHPSIQSAPRLDSRASASLRPEPQGRDEELLSGLVTPTTPNIQTFVDGQPPQRPGKSHRRESAQSTLSVANSMHSRSGGGFRPISPALSTRNGGQDIGARGRLSTESTAADERQQQHRHPQQLTRAKPSVPPYRPRQNKVGQSKGRPSTESKQESVLATPWFLENDYEPDEVLYNDNGALVAGTLDAYIEMLTSHKNTPDPAFVTTFFTTFRLFTDPMELVQLLKKRFVKPPPSGLDDQERMTWQQEKQERVQKRVQIALKTWLDGYWVSAKDRAAFKPIMDFVTQEMMAILPGPSGRMLDMLNQWANKRKSLNLHGRPQTLSKSRSHERINQLTQEPGSIQGSGITGSSSKPYATLKEKHSIDQSRPISRRGISAFTNRDSLYSRGPPVPLVNKALLSALASDATMAKVVVTDIKPVELARQLTIMVGKLLLEIPYLELLAKERPNCSRVVQLSNKITWWVTDTIVDEPSVKKRIGVLKHWVEVGEECLKLNNFETLMAISCAIESSTVRRLHNTWEGISKAYVERYEQLRKIISNDFNYSLYRAKLKTVQAPCVPFLGLYFTTITYIEDGNSIYKELNPPELALNSTSSATSIPVPPTTPTPVTTKKLLRYGRFSQLAKAVQEFRDLQGIYDLLEVPRMRDFILKRTETIDLERSYQKSKAIEPGRPTPSNIPGTGGSSGSSSQRSSISMGTRPGANRGLFYGGITNSEMSSGNSMPARLNKLSFFRKSTRTERP
ncbi:hypothetical protein BGZ54_003628 [Gamsiella multidivaricata]|nr:hypothetical protein BGZ54_003628 [Gamsiella multidivaricata]